MSENSDKKSSVITIELRDNTSFSPSIQCIDTASASNNDNNDFTKNDKLTVPNLFSARREKV